MASQEFQSKRRVMVAALASCIVGGVVFGIHLWLAEDKNFNVTDANVAAISAAVAVGLFAAFFMRWCLKRYQAVMIRSALLEEALDKMPSGVSLFDAQDRLVYVNSAFLEGRADLQEILKPGITFEEQIRIRESRGIRRTLGKAGEMVSIEDRLRHQREPGEPLRSETSSGRIVEVDVLKTASDGRFVVRRDITDRVHYETGLRESEKRFRDFASATSDWFWETDENLRFTYLSPGVEEKTGIPAEWHYGKTREELGTPGTVSESEWAAHQAILRDREPFRGFTYSRKGPEGDLWLVASGVPYFDDDGEFRGYRGLGNDVTRRVEAERSLEAVAAAIEELSEQFALWGPDDRLIICNEKWREINSSVRETAEPGTSFETHIRSAVERGLFPEADGREDEWIRGRLERHRNPGLSFETRRQDGRWLLVNEQKVGDGAIVTIATDITDRKKTESALLAAKEQAEIANRSKSEFLANMSHELRTPLNSIIGFAQIIAQQHPRALAEEKQIEYAGDILDSGKHLLGVISDILDISRIEAGEMNIEDRPVAMMKLAQSSVRMIRERSEARDVAINLEAIDPKLILRGDELRLRQVLINLLSNSVKFTPSGGSVSIEMTEIKSGEAVIRVRDTGIGIAAEDIPKIMQPFEQVRDSHAHAHEGTGLGLYLAKSLVEAHDGTLLIESTIGAGTDVTVTFPKSRICQSAKNDA